MKRQLLMGFALAGLMTAAPGEAQNAPRAVVAAWDTGDVSAEPWTPDALARKNAWRRIDAGPFRGDAVIANGRLLAVARKRGAGLELYSTDSGAAIFRARLLMAPEMRLESIALAEIGRGAAALDLTWKGGAARFRLPKGEPFVESQALSGEAPLRIDCAGRFAVLPDFFADDMLIDARRLPLDRTDLPSENFILHFTGPGDAVVMSVFEHREQEVRVTAAGSGADRRLTGSEIAYGRKGGKIWVGVLEGRGMWHSVDVTAADKKKVLPLDWRMPFIAQWRVDFTRNDDLTDSWDLLLPAKEGDGFVKPSWLKQDGQIVEATRTASGEVDQDAYKPGGTASERLGPDRKRWTTVLGHFYYPCWTDRDRKGFLQPISLLDEGRKALDEKMAFDGPVLVYPLHRLAETPIDSYTPVDLVRNTLGVGPCQYILDVEGQKQEHVGRATCHVVRLLVPIFKAKEQKAKRKEIENYLTDALDFVTHIRNRILAYVEFGRELRKYLAAQREAHPELKEAADALESLAREIDVRVEARMQQILQYPSLQDVVARVVERKEEPTPPALAAQLNRDFRENLLDRDPADWSKPFYKGYTDPLTRIGGPQDEMVGECRWVVKALRQKAGILMAREPKVAPLAAEVRARAQKILRGGAAYEGARH